jgi:hypothetical protein
MIKAKFRDHVRAKTDVAMVNEVLCKVLAHNICCLIQTMYELGVDFGPSPFEQSFGTGLGRAATVIPFRRPPRTKD